MFVIEEAVSNVELHFQHGVSVSHDNSINRASHSPVKYCMTTLLIKNYIITLLKEPHVITLLIEYHITTLIIESHITLLIEHHVIALLAEHSLLGRLRTNLPNTKLWREKSWLLAFTTGCLWRIKYQHVRILRDVIIACHLFPIFCIFLKIKTKTTSNHSMYTFGSLKQVTSPGCRQLWVHTKL